MATKRVMIVGGGLAGLSAAMKLAELGVNVDLMSLTPVKRSHSVCAQGGINSVNEVTRQQGDSEWLHLDDTVYGGDFLQHQPPVKEMADWAPKIIDLMDRLGVPFNRTPEGFRDQRRFGGTLFKRTAFAGATTGQQLLYALDDQVRRRCVAGQVKIYEAWDYLGPSARRQRRLPRRGRAGPGDDGNPRLSGRRRGHRLGRLRADLRPLDDVDGLHRQRRQPHVSGRREVRQCRVHPGASHGHSRCRQAAADERKRSRRRRPRVGAAQAARPTPREGDSRERALLLPRRALPEVRQPGAARHRHARDLQRLHARRAERREGSAVRLSRPDAHSAAKRST